jgi:F0F1-type ATP synthase membrane subunit a
MSKNIKEWLYSYLGLYVIPLGIEFGKNIIETSQPELIRNFVTFFFSIFLSPLLAIFGYFIALSSNSGEAPAYTADFKFSLCVALFVSISCFIFGLLNRHVLWGKLVNAAGFSLWCIGGVIALSPST